MRKASSLLEGEHDFKNFCKMKPEYEKNGTVRTIFSCKIYKIDDKLTDLQNKSFESRMSMCYLEVVGSGFLWHMVCSLYSMHYGDFKGYWTKYFFIKLDYRNA